MQSSEAKGAPTYQMTTRHVLIVLLGSFAALGFFTAYLAAHGIPEPRAVQLGSTVLFSLLTFTWYWLDSEVRAYRRSPFLSVSVVALGVLAIPYYLLRSRPKGERLKAIGRYFGFVVLLFVAFVTGSLPALFL